MPTANPPNLPILLAGYPDRYPLVFHRVRVELGDMTVFLENGSDDRMIMVRNIEVPRVRKAGRANEVCCPEDYAPMDGLSANRNVMFAEATAEYLRRKNIEAVLSDQMLPLLFVDVLKQNGITVECDATLGILERRMKDDEEIAHLAESQRVTELAIRHAYEIVRDADVVNDEFVVQGKTLTSECLQSAIAMFLLERGYASSHGCIAAGGPSGADCHSAGSGPLRINEPIILDVFPMGMQSHYSGDCTRTICRGTIDPRLQEMHDAVVVAKAASIAACKIGASGADVHEASCAVFRDRGYHIGMPPADAPSDLIFYPHGTGHGIGLETHEPPLLDEKNHDPLVKGDALTIEPGLYCHAIGGIRLEDMVIVTDDGCRNLNTQLSEDLWWD